MKEDAKFCPDCGAQQAQREQQQSDSQSVQGMQQQAYSVPTKDSAAQTIETIKSKFMSDKRYKIAGVVVLGVILILILFKACSGAGSRTMEGAVEKYYKAVVAKDGEDYLDITISDSLMKAVKKESDYTTKEMIEEMEEEIESEYKDVSKVKNIEVKDIQAAGSAQLEEMMNEIKEDSGVDVKISEMHQVEASFRYYDADDKEWKEDEEDLVVYKSGSRWYVLPAGIF